MAYYSILPEACCPYCRTVSSGILAYVGSYSHPRWMWLILGGGFSGAGGVTDPVELKLPEYWNILEPTLTDGVADGVATKKRKIWRAPQATTGNSAQIL